MLAERIFLGISVAGLAGEAVACFAIDVPGLATIPALIAMWLLARAPVAADRQNLRPITRTRTDLREPVEEDAADAPLPPAYRHVEVPARLTKSVSDPVLARNLSIVLWLEYVDVKGEPTERKITVRQVHGYPGPTRLTITHVTGFCHLRRDFRTFRVDRIKVAADGLTGEVIDDADAWLSRRIELRSPSHPMRAIG